MAPIQTRGILIFSVPLVSSLHICYQIPGPWPAQRLAALGSHVYFSPISCVMVGHMVHNKVALGAQSIGKRWEVFRSFSYRNSELWITLITGSESGMSHGRKILHKRKRFYCSLSIFLGDMKGTSCDYVHSAMQTFRKHVSKAGLLGLAFKQAAP